MLGGSVVLGADVVRWNGLASGRWLAPSA